MSKELKKGETFYSSKMGHSYKVTSFDKNYVNLTYKAWVGSIHKTFRVKYTIKDFNRIIK
jgi:hypothetical protein